MKTTPLRLSFILPLLVGISFFCPKSSFAQTSKAEAAALKSTSKEPFKIKISNQKLVDLIENADQFFSEGNYSKAKKIYSQVTNLAPQSPEGYLGLGRLALLEGSDEEALGHLKKATELAPQSADVHFELGSTYLSLGFIDNAIEQLATANSISPERPEISYKLSQARNLREAAKSVATGAEDYSDLDIDKASDLGVVFRLTTSGRVKEAIQQATMALDKHPDSPSLHYQLGILYKAQNSLEDALTEFKKALNLNPDHFLSLDQLTNIYIGRNQCDLADDYVKHWIDIDPDNPTAHFSNAWCQALAGSFPKAKEALKTSVRLDPRNTDLLNHYGLVLRELGDDSKAEDIFSRALALDPMASSPRLNLAMIYLADAKPEKADSAINPLRAQSYTSPDILAVSSLVHARLGKVKEAKEEAEAAYKIKPNHPVALVAQAEVLALTGKTDQAIDLLEEAHTKYPDNIFVLQELSETYAKLGKYDEAVAFAREAKKLNPDRIATDELLVFSLAKQNKIKEAKAIIAEINGLSDKEKNKLEGKIYEKAGKQSRAISYYQGLLKKSPYDENAHFRLANIYYKRRKFNPAIKHLFEVTDHNGGRIDARLLSAKILILRKKYKQALHECDEILRVNRHEKAVWNLIGQAKFKTRKYDQALDAFKKAETSNSLDIDGMITYAKLLMRQKKYSKAATVLAQAKNSQKLTDKLSKQIKKIGKDLPQPTKSPNIVN